MSKSSHHPDGRLMIALLLALTAITWLPSLGNDFINFDDPAYVTENPHVRAGLTWTSIAWAFTDTSQSNWHPLTWLSHMLDVELFDLQPAGHHCTSVALHIGCVIALYVLLRRMTRQPWPSALAAALFAVHPQHVESVAWVAERKDVLSAFLAILSLLAWQRYATRGGAKSYALSLALFALALLSKPMVVTLPFAMLLLDAWPLRRLDAEDRRTWWPLVWEKLPFFALSLIFSLIAYWAQRAGGSVGSADRYPLPRRLANAAVSCLHYVEQTIWPAKLSIFYPYPHRFSSTEAMLAVAVLLAITLLAGLLARRCRYLPVGWFWFIGMLVPVIGLVQIGRQSMADRYVYLPHIGLFIAIAWGLRDLTARSRRLARAAGAVSGVAIIALAATTVHQLGYWRDSTSLFTHALAVTRDNYLAHHQLGNELARREPPDLQGAEKHYRRALSMNPDHAKSHLNLGNVLARRGADVEAIEQFEAALRLDPRLEAAERSLAYVRSRHAATRPASQPLRR